MSSEFVEDISAASVGDTDDEKCSFCRRPVREAGMLVAGPEIFICPACVELAADVVEHFETEAKHAAIEAHWSSNAPSTPTLQLRIVEETRRTRRYYRCGWLVLECAGLRPGGFVELHLHVDGKWLPTGLRPPVRPDGTVVQVLRYQPGVVPFVTRAVFDPRGPEPRYSNEQRATTSM